MEGRLHVPTAVVAALLVGALANLAEYPSIERDAGNWYRALRVKSGHELPALGDEHFASTQARFSFYLAIRDHAYGATLVASRDATVNPELLRGLAAVGGLERTDAPMEVDRGVADRLDGDVIDSGEDEHLGPWAVAVSQDDAPDRLLLVAGPGRSYLVTPELLRAAGGEVAGVDEATS